MGRTATTLSLTVACSLTPWKVLPTRPITSWPAEAFNLRAAGSVRTMDVSVKGIWPHFSSKGSPSAVGIRSTLTTLGAASSGR